MSDDRITYMYLFSGRNSFQVLKFCNYEIKIYDDFPYMAISLTDFSILIRKTMLFSTDAIKITVNVCIRDHTRILSLETTAYTLAPTGGQAENSWWLAIRRRHII